MVDKTEFKTEDEDHVKLCRVFLQGLTNNKGSPRAQHRSSWGDDLKGFEVKQDICHHAYRKREASVLRATASGLLPHTKNKEVALKFWEWVSGDKSPWRLIFKNKEVELVLDKDGAPLGYIVFGKTAQTVPFSFLKNFAILCRSVTERKDQWKFWYYLVTKKNLNPSEAFYLISVFAPMSDNSDELLLCEFRTGGHWALTDGVILQCLNENGVSYPGPFTQSRVAVFDWKAFKTGVPKFDIDYGPNLVVNGCFCSETILVPYSEGDYTNKSSFKVKEIPSTKTTNKFSHIESYNIDVVIDYLKKFLDQEGVLDVD